MRFLDFLARAERRPSSRRVHARILRMMIRERARLAAVEAAKQPIVVGSAAAIEVRVLTLACARCAGELRVDERVAASAQLDDRAPRRLLATCRRCGAPRELWFRIAADDAN